MDFCTSQTKVNLAKAYAGESQARGRYDFLAEKLREEGYYEMSKVVLSVAANELAHSKVFFDTITSRSGELVRNVDIAAGYPFKCGGLVETLNYAVEDEACEFNEIYPAFAESARREGFDDIARRFEQIAEIEKSHARVLGELAMKLETNQFFASRKPRIFKCSNCGHETVGTSAWEICPVCSHPKGFIELELENRY